MAEAGATSSRSTSLGLFLLSAALLTLEVLHARLLSVLMWYHHAFVVVTMAMLGFAAAGTLVTLWPGLRRGDVGGRLAWSAILFGVAVTVGQLLLTRTADAMTTIPEEGEFGLLVAVDALLMLPYLFGGIVVTLALATAPSVHSRYFFNLAGSALGAWLFVATIGPLQGERLLIACAAAGPAAALLFAGRSRLPRVVAVVALAAAALFFVNAPAWVTIELGEGKRRHVTGTHVDQRWTPLCRLDLFANDPKNPSQINILQDGGAGTFLTTKEGFAPPLPVDPHAVGYVPHLRRMREGGLAPDVFVIGVGGGVDLRIALANRAASVLGVEINATTVQLLERDYAGFDGDLLHQPGVSIVVGEGRSTLRRLDRKFDLIQLAGVDTYTAGVVGSFVLSESYLYTREAMRDYFDHLKPGGTIGVMRFYDEPDRETLRLFGMALLELRRRGVARPSQNAVVIRSRWSSGLVFSIDPIDRKDVDVYRLADKDPAGRYEVVYVPELGLSRSNAFTQLAAAIEAGTEEQFFAGYSVDARPVSDDAPFFFNCHHVWDARTIEDSAYARSLDSRIPVAPSILRRLLLQSALLVVVLVVLPLFALRRRGLRGEGTTRGLAYFLAIGAGFMLLEVSSIQRLALFLGHPTCSLTVVLFGFLSFAGLGSAWAGRFLRADAKGTRIALSLLVVVIAAFTLGIDVVTRRFLALPLPLRIATAIGCLAPMSFLMGIPFPMGLAQMARTRPALVPWAIGANGGASVVASVVAIIVAMEWGFTTVALVALGCYVAALLAARPPDATTPSDSIAAADQGRS